jgi:hypothetical protein
MANEKLSELAESAQLRHDCQPQQKHDLMREGERSAATKVSRGVNAISRRRAGGYQSFPRLDEHPPAALRILPENEKSILHKSL